MEWMIWLIPLGVALWAKNERRKRIEVERLVEQCDAECEGLSPLQELGVRKWYLQEIETMTKN